MKASTFFIGLAAGAVTSAITVLYSTPKPGSELRSSVKTASQEMKDKLKDVRGKVADLKDSVTDLTKETKELVPETVEEMKDSVADWKRSTEHNKKRLEKEISAIQIALEDLEKSISNR
ncbi:YtxH domain-containing protein [Sporosarcina sp. FSL W7-1283]|uniref:YtxH domain-containing protein n=1 Tax=Sporosarcina sp. FSL W7-1283 TaxID=2921560 RepID=UPI0030F855C1